MLAYVISELMAGGPVRVTGDAKEYTMTWFLLPAAILLLIVLTGRTHTRYLNKLQADPQRQLMLGVSFERSVPTGPVRHRSWIQQVMLDLS
ncbi:hypothetical protein QWJ07_07900 [Frankia sp. RB7]|nr:hypothetical protein [Frankia sp. RB7]